MQTNQSWTILTCKSIHSYVPIVTSAIQVVLYYKFYLIGKFSLKEPSVLTNLPPQPLFIPLLWLEKVYWVGTMVWLLATPTISLSAAWVIKDGEDSTLLSPENGCWRCLSTLTQWTNRDIRQSQPFSYHLCLGLKFYSTAIVCDIHKSVVNKFWSQKRSSKSEWNAICNSHTAWWDCAWHTQHYVPKKTFKRGQRWSD